MVVDEGEGQVGACLWESLSEWVVLENEYAVKFR